MLIRLIGLASAVISVALICLWAGSFTGQQWTLARAAGMTACLAVFTTGTLLALFGQSPRQSMPAT